MDDVKIRINSRCNRFYIQKDILFQLGSPQYLKFGYDSSEMILMFYGVEEYGKRTVRIHLNSNGAFYIESKALIEAIRHVNQILTKTASYEAPGELREGGVWFYLKKAVVVYSAADSVSIPQI